MFGIRWKALEEIYKIYMHFCTAQISKFQSAPRTIFHMYKLDLELELHLIVPLNVFVRCRRYFKLLDIFPAKAMFPT